MLSAKDKKGIVLIVVVAMLFVAILILQSVIGNKPKAGYDNCVGDIVANTVIVLDYTDQINDQTRNEISVRAMEYVRNKVKVNERVSIFVISDQSKKSLTPLVSLCKPPDEGNRIVENVSLIQKRFHQNFEKPIHDILLSSPSDSKESPIAQVITDLSLSQYLRGSSNTLLVFSDMLEHTAKFSLYKCSAAARVITNYRESRIGALERPIFKNVNVKLNLVPRLDQTKDMLKCRDIFWPWFFGNNQGPNALLNIDYLPGGTPMGSISSGVKK